MLPHRPNLDSSSFEEYLLSALQVPLVLTNCGILPHATSPAKPPFPLFCFHRLSLRFSPHRTKHLCWAAHEPVPPPVQFSSSPSPLPSKRGVIFKITPFVLQRRWAGWVLGAWRPKGFRSSHSLPPTSPPHLHLHLHLLVCVLSSGLKPKKRTTFGVRKLSCR